MYEQNSFNKNTFNTAQEEQETAVRLVANSAIYFIQYLKIQLIAIMIILFSMPYTYYNIHATGKTSDIHTVQ